MLWRMLFTILLACYTSYCCYTNNDILIDIMFVVDGSGSIGNENFQLVKEWLINATSTMAPRFGRRAFFGVLQYSNKDPPFLGVPIERSKLFEIPFRLGECRDQSCMKQRITNMRYLAQQTFTYYALRRVLEVEFPFSLHGEKSKKAIILLTDGAANDATDIPTAYKETVRRGITNFAIGVGDYRKQQLRLLANGGHSDQRVFERADFDSLFTLTNTLQQDLENEGFFCDECASKTDNCSKNATCINHVNGYDCVCNTGYAGDGYQCEDINDCNPNPCKKSNSECIDGVDSFQCDCKVGFNDTGVECEDIDECSSDPCQFEFSHCTDVINGYVCTCDEGYEWNEKICSDPYETINIVVMIVTYFLSFSILLAICLCALLRRRRRERKFVIAEEEW